ncbi:MAG: lysophospholipid acyltransferase family protein [Spirochaetia bacterium]|jgi:1-acyl-sn-glycerol-3-phosphate acyltransferase
MSTLASAYRWCIGLVWVGFLCASVIVASLFFPERAWDPFFKAMQKGLFRVLFIPVEVRGAAKVARRAGVLFMANHVSLFDVPLLGGFLPGMVRGVEWAAHFRWPLFGLLLRRVGNIPIDRENAFSAMDSLRKARKRLAARQSLVILPEAHRTMDGELLPFKRLPFHMARDAGVDIVPVGLSGLYSLKNKHSWKIRSVRLKIAIGEAITREEIAGCSLDELRAMTRQRIAGLIERR